MANSKSLRLAVGSIFPKGPGKVYFYRYQVDGRRKTVSLQTVNRVEALKKAQALVPIVKASTPEIVAAHVEYAKGFREVERNLCVSDIWDYYSRHPERAIPATINEKLQYQASLQEFIDFLNDPCGRCVTSLPRLRKNFRSTSRRQGLPSIPITVNKNHTTDSKEPVVFYFALPRRADACPTRRRCSVMYDSTLPHAALPCASPRIAAAKQNGVGI